LEVAEGGQVDRSAGRQRGRRHQDTISAGRSRAEVNGRFRKEKVAAFDADAVALVEPDAADETAAGKDALVDLGACCKHGRRRRAFQKQPWKAIVFDVAQPVFAAKPELAVVAAHNHFVSDAARLLAVGPEVAV